MKLCFPVTQNVGLDSMVYSHFGSAPMFMVVDTETRDISEINNRDLNHRHGGCSPVKALGQGAADAVVVSGIGAGALNGLRRAGYQVLLSQGTTIAANLACLDQLSPVEAQLCSGHGEGHGHSHGQGHGCHH